MQTLAITLHDFDRASEHPATIVYRVNRPERDTGYAGGVEVLSLACDERPEWRDDAAVMEAAEDALAAGDMDDDDLVVTVRGADEPDRLAWEANASAMGGAL